jgi:DNA-binding beta-propeller fold protein YncE
LIKLLLAMFAPRHMVLTCRYDPALRSLLNRSLRPPGPGAPPAGAPALPGATARHTGLPAWPFAVAIAPDAAVAYVSMPREGHRGLVALTAAGAATSDQPWTPGEPLWLTDGAVPRGIAVTADGHHLIVADSSGGLLVLSAERVRSGAGDGVVERIRGAGSGTMELAIEPAGRFVLATDEESASLSVFDFGTTLSAPGQTPSGHLVGATPLPPDPVGIDCAPGGRHVFVTSQSGSRSGGVLSTLALDEVCSDPPRAAVRSEPAGAGPVRVVVGPDGATAWVTARGSNALLAFDVESLLGGRGRALRAVVAVGTAPVGVACLPGQPRVVVANSNRYASDRGEPQTLSVIDSDAALAGRPALLGTVPAGAFPRAVLAVDDRTLLITNVYSRTLETVSLC